LPDYIDLLPTLKQPADSKIVMLVLDGLGGLPHKEKGLTELELANTPNLDDLAGGGICGLSEAVGPGITPGSGPSHLALFGYDPIAENVGRGVLSALGVGFELGKDDLAARINFATIDKQGAVIDRRAGRISDELNRRLCDRLGAITVPGVEIFLKTEREHRAVVVFRGENLSDELLDTDPQQLGVPPLDPVAVSSQAEATASIVGRFQAEARRALANEYPANMILLRGFAKLPTLTTLPEAHGFRCAAIAAYPMYRGLGQLVGMEVLATGNSIGEELDTLRGAYGEYDFFFVHVKSIDSRGEDGDFDGKVAVIEEMDRLVPRITDLKPHVLVVTGDHSTPANLGSHSWHPTPFLLSSPVAMPDETTRFGERACAGGGLGVFPARSIMSLVLAHALRLKKFGA
jgi:2,3-bisphosphoglycerate-independent phosphoglycerate mutase